MKERVREFLSNNCILIPTYIALICIAIWDSTIALVIYAVIMHVVLLGFIVGLWNLENIKPQSRNILHRILHALVIIVVLVITKHWYVLCVSLLYIFLMFVYVYDEWKIASDTHKKPAVIKTGCLIPKHEWKIASDVYKKPAVIKTGCLIPKHEWEHRVIYRRQWIERRCRLCGKLQGGSTGPTGKFKNIKENNSICDWPKII